MLNFKLYQKDESTRYGIFNKNGNRLATNSNKYEWRSVSAAKSAFNLHLKRQRISFNRFYKNKTIENVIEEFPNTDLILFDCKEKLYIFVTDNKITYSEKDWKKFCNFLLDNYVEILKIS